MRKSSTILEELNENKELAKATGLAADEKDFIEGEIADLEKEYEAALTAEKNTPAPKKKEVEPVSKKPAAPKMEAPVETPAEKPKKAKKAPKTQDEMAFIVYKGKKIYENEPEYCEKSIEAWKERKVAQKKAAGKYKTKPVIQKVASNIVSAVAKGIDTIKHEDIKDNPKEAIKKMEQLEKAGKQFLEAYKNILGEKISDKAIKEEFEGLDETIKKISEKYLAEKTKFESGGDTKKLYYYAVATSGKSWDENEQEEFYGTWKDVVKKAYEVATKNKSTVRVSSTEGFNNQGSYFNYAQAPKMADGGSTSANYEVELHWKGLSDGRKIGKYVVSEKTLNEIEEQWSHVISVDVLDESDKETISWYNLKKQIFDKGREKGFFENGGEVDDIESDKLFNKVYDQYNSKDYWDVKGQINTQVNNWKRALERGDENAKKYTEKEIVDIVTENNKVRTYYNTYLPLVEAINKVDKQFLISRVRYDQKFGKAIFEEYTGVKLPSTNSELKAYFNSATFYKFANGGEVDNEEEFHKRVREWMANNLPAKYHKYSLDEVPLYVFNKKLLKERNDLLNEFYKFANGGEVESEFVRLARLGVVESTDENGDDDIQRIDSPEYFAEENGLDFIPPTLIDDDHAKLIKYLDDYSVNNQDNPFENGKEYLVELVLDNGGDFFKIYGESEEDIRSDISNFLPNEIAIEVTEI